MAITSTKLRELGLIDEIVPEPLGGAHRNPDEMAGNLREKLIDSLEQLRTRPMEQLLEERYSRLMSYGVYSE
ncbi:MAG TPA: hypothetical protein EYP90_07415 [Chromatiaceae bacterium]|nr:hypothetical protein [Chromatiaceae bacterium]